VFDPVAKSFSEKFYFFRFSLLSGVASSDFVEKLLVTVGFHGLVDAVEVSGQRFVQVEVVEVSVPLEAVTGQKFGQFGIASGDEGQSGEVLDQGVVVEGATLVGDVAESGGNARGLS
jgi:hypothetical protein